MVQFCTGLLALDCRQDMLEVCRLLLEISCGNTIQTERERCLPPMQGEEEESQIYNKSTMVSHNAIITQSNSRTATANHT